MLASFLSGWFAQLLTLASFLSGWFLQHNVINVSSLVCKQLLCSRSHKSVLTVIHSHCPCNWGNHCIVETINLFLQCRVGNTVTRTQIKRRWVLHHSTWIILLQLGCLPGLQGLGWAKLFKLCRMPRLSVAVVIIWQQSSFTARFLKVDSLDLWGLSLFTELHHTNLHAPELNRIESYWPGSFSRQPSKRRKHSGLSSAVRV